VPGFIPPPHAPEWFVENINCQRQSCFTEIEGRKVHYLCWNQQQKELPALLFVHGFGGHAHWWSFFAPFFLDRFRVYAVDLPGMGDSDAAPGYDSDCFARAIVAVVEQAAIGPATIVGHSFGGVHSLFAMALAPSCFRHGIVVDSNLDFPRRIPSVMASRVSPHKRHPTREACLERFVLSPEQPEVLDYVKGYVGYHSCRQDGGGWFWKFDPAIRAANFTGNVELLKKIHTPVHAIYGEKSPYIASGLSVFRQGLIPDFRELLVVPGAYHHIAIDHPLELRDALRQLV